MIKVEKRRLAMDTQPTSVRIRDFEVYVAPEMTQKQILEMLAEKHHWAPPRTFRTADMITEKVVEKDWWFEPIHDYSVLPQQAQSRINLILQYIGHLDLILAHEIPVEPIIKPDPFSLPTVKPTPLPWVLPPKKPQPQRTYPLRPQPEPWRAPDIDWSRVKEVAGQTAKVAGVVLGVVGLATVATLGILGSALCGIDPLVIICDAETQEWTVIYQYSE
jgi:hypothetical protein